MANKNSKPTYTRLSYLAASSLLIGMLAFGFSADGWPASVAAGSHASKTASGVISVPAKLFDAKANSPAASATSKECASIAALRWLPNSTINIGYAGGDFTDGERAAFLQAISLWNEALKQINVGILLNNIGEKNKDAVPLQSQVIVKRDYSMDSGHNGKIIAAVRRDNYMDQAIILINGSIHESEALRKTLLHELGHGFGLQDCPDCRSGTTVMNYFFQTSLMGFKIGKGSSRISSHPTACDISQVASGYMRSPPPVARMGTDGSTNTEIVVADDSTVSPDTKSFAGDENIVAPYLRALAAKEVSPRSLAPVAGSDSTRTPITSILNFAAANSSTGLRLSRTLNPELYGASIAIVTTQPARTTAEGPPFPGSGSPGPSETPAAAPGIRAESVLSDSEKSELESFKTMMLDTEAETMKELNNYTFRREVLIQTIDNKGHVSGEYRRTSDLLFDDAGERIERGLTSSKSTLRRLKISPEYLEDFSGSQLKGFELANRDHYRIEPFMIDNTNGISMRVYRITPLNLNVERSAQARVFYGFVWVSGKTGRILKIKGCALPDDKQRFPLFETQRELIDGVHLFPARTIADDYLVFPSHTIHVRMLITYTNYKKFASRVSVIEVDSGR